MAPPRGRFAPSPTGKLHLGNARSALLGWLWARALGGEFLLRIEDLDTARCRPAFTALLMKDLEWLGLTWDGTPLVQSQRREVYEAALQQLAQAGRLYDCFCTRAEIARAATAPHGPTDEGPRYPGTCRALSPATARAREAQGRRPALRFLPPEGEVSFSDALAGPQVQDVAAQVGDFVVRRNDGVASYQLAVVVDDAASGVTHVLRGDDLLSSTPRQLLLQRVLGLPQPHYAHVPLVLGEDGRRLSKREGAFALSDLREAGVAPERVVGLLARWSGLGPGGPVAAAELVPGFSLEAVQRAPAVTSEADIRAALGL